jgi:hypothetical protein
MGAFAPVLASLRRPTVEIRQTVYRRPLSMAKCGKLNVTPHGLQNMNNLTDYPLLVFVLSFVALWGSALIGAAIRGRNQKIDEASREDFGVILAAILTLLGLIIGFSFSMAISRYDQRKNLEEAEANANGTEFVRADLLPAADAAKVRALLGTYLEQRVLFYTTRDDQQLREINAKTAHLQADLWSAVKTPAMLQPTPVIALAVTGMNDVLNSQGYTQAAWWNRIPHAAWGLMAAIAICCNLLVGYGAHNAKTEARLLLVLPLVVALSFFLIADIDSPRGGVIRVSPQNLHSLAASLHGQ